MISLADLDAILAELPQLRAGVIGDFALDLYYDYRDDTGKLSVETGLPVYHGDSLRTAPGGAGGVAANLTALGVGRVAVFGVTGDDLYGRELRHRLGQAGVDTAGLVQQDADWITQTYVKPMRGHVEQNRLDFGETNRCSPASRAALLAGLEAALGELDLLIVNQQFHHPLLDPETLAGLNAVLAKRPGLRVYCDCRDLPQAVPGAVVKMNDEEATRLLARPTIDAASDAACRAATIAVAQQLGTTVVMTRGPYGLVAAGPSLPEPAAVPGLQLTGELDTVGAGDAAMAGLAAVAATGAPWSSVLAVANLAAGVTVQKLGEAGTASAADVRELNATAAYTCHPDIAANRRLARYLPSADIEVVTDRRPRQLRHVILDHDGTISTIREGWEEVMHDVALQFIAGDRLATLDVATHDRLAATVQQLIEQTTGVQTIRQMIALTDLIRREGLVPVAEIRSPAAYKAAYLDALMETVRQRLDALAAGHRQTADFTVKGAVDLLRELQRRGLTVYLASGTDEADVRHEAEVLGYADVFTGGIHGSIGNELGDAKAKVVRRILADTGSDGSDLLIIGDGPVEIREGRRAGATCIAVASDEVRRYGWNWRKRRRLIAAGADIVLPDFSQLPALLTHLDG